ncbi:NIPSNAP family protein [Amorphus sp. MBR-141]
MIFELRNYKATPGSVDKLHRRFEDHTLALFARHGISLVGFWVPEEDEERIVYLVRFESDAARKAAWDAFQADPDWKRVKAESEADGPIVASLDSMVLSPTSYGNPGA